MTPKDFAYWLQGYFEIAGAKAVLTQKTATQVLGKANAVVIAPHVKKPIDLRAQFVPMPQKDHAEEFVTATKTLLTALVTASPKAPAEEYKAATETLRSSLNDLFIHAIDQGYDGDQNHFDGLHGNKPGDDMARC